MSTFLAFRTAVISVLKYRAPPRRTRYISATSSLFANGSFTPYKTGFNKSATLLTPNKGAKAAAAAAAATTTGEEPPKEKKSTSRRGPLKDEEIKYPIVQITHDGQLSSPTTVRHLLSLLDRKGYYVQLVSHRPPVVKIVNRADEYNRKKHEHEQAKLARAKRGAHKEVQLSWATGEADAAHKLEKVREDLGKKGFRVDLVFAHKKGQPVPSLVEAREKVQAVVDSLADVGKEWKERRVQRRMAAVFLQGVVVVVKDEETSEGVGVENMFREELLAAVEKNKRRRQEKDRKASQKHSESTGVTSREDANSKKLQVDPIPQEIWGLFRQ